MKSFHHWAITITLGLPNSANALTSANALGEKSFRERQLIVARRLWNYVHRRFDFNYQLTKTLKSGKKIYVCDGKAVCSTDYIDRLHSMFVEACAEENDLDKPLKFDIKFCRKTVKSLKRLISRHAKVSAVAKKAREAKKKNQK